MHEMNLEERINKDLIQAMKAKDKPAIRTIRAIKSALLLQKTDGSGESIDAAGEIKLIQKLVKQRQESLSIYEDQGRADLAATEREEIEVLENYLPEQMSQEALDKYIGELTDRLGASEMKDMGKVMGVASKELAGKADGRTISEIVKKKLSS